MLDKMRHFFGYKVDVGHYNLKLLLFGHCFLTVKFPGNTVTQSNIGFGETNLNTY